MNKKQLFIFLIIAILILSTIAITIAKKSSTLSPQQDAFKSYFEEKMLKLSGDQQQDFNAFQELSPIDKFLSATSKSNQPKVQKQPARK